MPHVPPEHVAPILTLLSFTIASHYGFYLDGDGVAPNGAPAGFGINFPTSNVDKGDYFLRTDYLPNRLFRYDGARWIKIEDSVRIITTNKMSLIP